MTHKKRTRKQIRAIKAKAKAKKKYRVAPLADPKKTAEGNFLSDTKTGISDDSVGSVNEGSKGII